MALEIFVASAVQLPAARIGKYNPYVHLDLRGIRKQTAFKADSADPSWEELVVFDLSGTKPLMPDDTLGIQVKSHETLGANKVLGTASLVLGNILTAKGPQTYDVHLEDGSKKPAGTLYLKLTYHAKEGTGQDASGLNTSGARGGNAAKPREFSNKPEKFQIRVKVIEARHLVGDSVNPLCSIRIGEEVRQTQVQRVTNQPWWDETFVLNVSKVAAEFFEDDVVFEVLNSKFLRSSAFIGSFSMSVQTVYNEPEHAFINKWLLLEAPEADEDSDCGVLGYLKVSVAVLATGDECPSFKTNPQSFDEDVESNLLWPESGVTLQPATFQLILYLAEDLPRMDSAVMDDIRKFFGSSAAEKELVDPYMKFSFCGREVASKVVYTSDHPKWFQTLNLGFLFPSLCNAVKLVLMDWDRVSEDDLIATEFINLSKISSSGEDGFLPTFGPCFVNFYGSGREYSPIQSSLDVEMDSGNVEGFSYRGRVLLSLRTSLGEYPETPLFNLDSDDMLRVAPFCRRRKYILRAVFLDAGMIGEINDLVEFEVSMGLYGDRCENTSMPSISSTQPASAVFDGSMYNYIPWTKSKPCVMIPCQWEDISFRLEGLNVLERALENLEKNVSMLERLQRAGIQQEDQMTLISGILDQLIEDCSVKLPHPVNGYHVANDLDKLMRVQREKTLYKIAVRARNLQTQVSSVDDVMDEVETFISMLRKAAMEPQNSMPDIIVSMIINKKRVAYYRIPAYQILYSTENQLTGRLCDNVQTLQLKVPGQVQPEKIPALLRMKFWLGLETEYNSYSMRDNEEAELCTYAETYENQVNILGSWKARGPTLTRPAWSDVLGQLNLPREKFFAPVGWIFEGYWFVDPEINHDLAEDSGVSSYLEIIIENQSRGFSSSWHSNSNPWIDTKGNATVSWEEFEIPDGWIWDDCWQIDLHRAVDEEGWEYAIDANFGGFSSTEKNYHMFRRRRWTRRRIHKLPSKSDDFETSSQTSSQSDDSNGWEYAPMFSMKFHYPKQKMDLVRRRRWHRKMVPVSAGPLPIFHMPDEKKSDKIGKTFFQNDQGGETSTIVPANVTVPRMYLVFTEEHKYQLHVYLYQARDLIAGDKTGFSDPFACVCFQKRSQMSEIVNQTLCPSWDQTLIFEQLTLYGQPWSIKNTLPTIVVELYDHDAIGAPEFLGRTTMKAKVHNEDDKVKLSPKLTWHAIHLGKKSAGELLAAAEIFQMDEGFVCPTPPRRGNLFRIPETIKPVLQRTAIEILCWGVRNMKPYELLAVTHPSVSFEVGDKVIESAIIKDSKKTPNFKEPLLFIELMIPRDDLYMPPINIKVKDHRQFGRTPIVGVHVITSLQPYFCTCPEDDILDEDPDNQHEYCPKTSLMMQDGSEDENNNEEDLDWWSKYYASTGELQKSGDYLLRGYEPITIYPTELERVDDFEGFNDLLTTFPLQRGKNLGSDENDGPVGEFKGTLRVYRLPDDDKLPSKKVLRWFPNTCAEEVVVRVYIIRAYDLTPKDQNGLADPYVIVKLGKQKESSRDKYKPNTLTPLFGQMFEMSATLPLQKDLTIQVYDMDLISSDDLIGETTVDLENRHLSSHRATCGLPRQYYTRGPYRWRDALTPSDILEKVCQSLNMSPPVYRRGAYHVGKNVYTLYDFEKKCLQNPCLGPVDQRLALHVLHTLRVVPEHVEVRRLYNPSIPGLDQGKLEMWVDIFPKSLGPPGMPINILPRTAQRYELRCIIWNTKEVALKDTNTLTGENMSDIYVKGMIDGSNESQQTDVHYRSMDGDGNFNWRFTFQIDYLPAEKVLMIRKKEHFWEMDAREYFYPPKLCIQVWDNDVFASDDFIGSIDIELLSLPKPVKQPESCGIHQLKTKKKKNKKTWWKRSLKAAKNKIFAESIDLFEKKHVYGYWPVVDDTTGELVVTGKVEMELELLTKQEAEEKPAGRGRDEPNLNPHLEPPKRPEVMLQWMLTPWKVFRVGIWGRIRWHVLIVFLIAILVLFILIALYSLPSAFVTKVFGSI